MQIFISFYTQAFCLQTLHILPVVSRPPLACCYSTAWLPGATRHVYPSARAAVAVTCGPGEQGQGHSVVVSLWSAPLQGHLNDKLSKFCDNVLGTNWSVGL